MDALKALACLRAAGSLMVAAYKEVESANPAFNESQLAAAEDWARKNVGSAGSPTPAGNTVSLPVAMLAAAKAAVLAAGSPAANAAPASAWTDGMDGAIPFRYIYADPVKKTGAVRVDGIVPSGTPGTVTIAKTGHVLSLPQPEGKTQAGTPERLMGYFQRVADQCTGGKAEAYMASLATLQIGAGMGATADVGTWPQAADQFFNFKTYMTAEELAAADAPWAGYVIQKP